MHSDKRVSLALQKRLKSSDIPASSELTLAMQATDLAARRAHLCRTFSHLSYPETQQDDYLGMLCSKLGYGVAESDREAFVKAECNGTHAPGLCRTCYYLHLHVPVTAVSEHCTKCQSPTVTGGLTLASRNTRFFPLV